MAKVSGIAIRPVVSKNGRRYSKEVLAKAAKRMQERLADESASPITMRTHHGAADDSMRIAGRITSVGLNDEGAITYEGETTNTDAGRTMATLAKKGKDGRQALEHVSIRGSWLGPVMSDEEGHTFADDLEIDGIDFTAAPGIPGASVTSESHETNESAEVTPITESAEEATFVDDTPVEADGKTPKKPYGNVTYADPGYQKDGKKRYPLNSEERVRAAWDYINKQSNADKYSANQLARIKSKIKAAGKKFGIKFEQEAAVLHDELIECFVEEAYVSMSLSHGGGWGDDEGHSINVSGSSTDPARIKGMATKVAAAAIAAHAALDPDNDGAVDDDDEESAEDEGELESTDPTQADGSSATTKEATVPTDTQTPESAPAAATAQLSEADIDAIAAKLAEKMTPPAPPVDESKPEGEGTPEPKKLTLEDIPDEVFAKLQEKVRDDLLAKGIMPSRQGLVRRLDENAEAKTAADLAAMDAAEFRQYAADLWNDVLPPVRAQATSF